MVSENVFDFRQEYRCVSEQGQGFFLLAGVIEITLGIVAMSSNGEVMCYSLTASLLRIL